MVLLSRLDVALVALSDLTTAPLDDFRARLDVDVESLRRFGSDARIPVTLHNQSHA